MVWGIVQAKLMDLSQEKSSLEERLEALGLKDEKLRERILYLDTKVGMLAHFLPGSRSF